MIRASLMTRKELVELIKKSPQTTDGYYFCPRFKALVMLEGPNQDGQYQYDRYLFRRKMCFTNDDIKVFLSERELPIDEDLITITDAKMEDALNGLEMLKLSDKVPNGDYNLDELIDTAMFIIREKYGLLEINNV